MNYILKINYTYDENNEYEITNENIKNIDVDDYNYEIIEIVNENINNTNTLNFLTVYENKIDEIDEINNDNIEIIDEINDKILNLYVTLKYKDVNSINIYKEYSLSSYHISLNDLFYFLKYKINSLKEKKFKKLYVYNSIINFFKDFYNISDEKTINDLNNYFKITYDEYDEKIYFNNNCYYLNKYTYNKNINDLIKDLNKYQYQQYHQYFNYIVIFFDEINISYLNYFNNLYNNISNNVFDDEIENINENRLYDNYNVDIFDKYNLNCYYSIYDNENKLLFDVDDVYDEIYDVLFNEIIYNYNDNIEINDVIYENKYLLINKDFIKRVNKTIDNYYDKFIYYASYENKYILNKDNIFKYLLKTVNDDIYNYYDLIEIIINVVNDNYILKLDDFNLSNYNNIVDSNLLYIYIKDNYDKNLIKDDLILI